MRAPPPSNEADTTGSDPSADPGVPASKGDRRIDSRSLLGPSGVLVIEHAGRDYRLRVTQNGKLILTA